MYLWIGCTIFVILYTVNLYFLHLRVVNTVKAAKAVKSGTTTPPVTIIHPTYGSDRFTEDNFNSWLNQDYQGKRHYIYSFQRENDPGIEVAEKLQTDCEKTLICNPVLPGYSGKMSNLAHAFQIAKDEIIIMADRDCYVEKDTISKIITEFEKGADIVSCLPIHYKFTNLWARLFSFSWNFYGCCLHLFKLAENQNNDAMGVCLAVERSVFEKLGGLAAFKDYIAEDVVIGREAGKAGLRIALGPVVHSPVDSLSFKDYLDKATRGALIMVFVSPFENFKASLIATYPLILIAGLILQNWPLIILTFLVARIRVFFAALSNKQFHSQNSFHLHVLLMDLADFLIFFYTSVTKTTKWGGITYKVDKTGRMTRV